MAFESVLVRVVVVPFGGPALGLDTLATAALLPR
jgi:hypothetical protein